LVEPRIWVQPFTVIRNQVAIDVEHGFDSLGHGSRNVEGLVELKILRLQRKANRTNKQRWQNVRVNSVLAEQYIHIGLRPRSTSAISIFRRMYLQLSISTLRKSIGP
jgi:hypothetical protein